MLLQPNCRELPGFPTPYRRVLAWWVGQLGQGGQHDTGQSERLICIRAHAAADAELVLANGGDDPQARSRIYVGAPLAVVSCPAGNTARRR